MIERDKFIKSFECITPSEKVIEEILKADRLKIRRQYRMKKAVVMAVCICIIMSFGGMVSAGNIIDFNDVFGNYIRLDDSSLSEKIAGTVSNVRYTVSDDRFGLSVKGAFATDSEIIAMIELSANDSKSVAEHFEKSLSEEKIRMAYFYSEIKADSERVNTGYALPYISDSNNIEIMLRIPLKQSKENVAVTVGGHNFYSEKEYLDFCEENNVFYDRLRFYEGYYTRDSKPVDIDDSDIRLLSLDWKIKFDFSSSGENSESVYCDNLLDEITLYYLDGQNNVNDAVLKSVSFEAGAARAKMSFDCDTLHINKINEAGNEWYIIKSDGEHIPLVSDYIMGGSSLDGGYSHDIGFIYEKDGMPLLLNTDDIYAVFINGTVFEF